MENYDRFFKAFAHQTRRQIIRLIFSGKARTLTELLDFVKASPMPLQKHLRTLIRGGIVRKKRVGRSVEYHIDPKNILTPWELFVGFLKKTEK